MRIKLHWFFLTVLLTVGALAAALGTWSLLVGSDGALQFGGYQYIFVAGAYCLACLAAAYLRERGAWPSLMVASIVACILAAACLLVVTFLYIHYAYRYMYRFDIDKLLIIAACLLAIFAGANVIAGAISLTKLRGKARRARTLAIVSIYGSATIIATLIVLGILGRLFWDESTYVDVINIGVRIAGLSLVVVLFAITALPILFKMQGMAKLASMVSTSQHVRIHCPRCFLDQTITPGLSRCRHCRLTFNLHIEEPQCPTCGYVLHNLSRPICPECGEKLSPDELPAQEEEQAPNPSVSDPALSPSA